MVDSLLWSTLAEHPVTLLTIALFLEWLLPLPISFRPSALVALFEQFGKKVIA